MARFKFSVGFDFRGSQSHTRPKCYPFSPMGARIGRCRDKCYGTLLRPGSRAGANYWCSCRPAKHTNQKRASSQIRQIAVPIERVQDGRVPALLKRPIYRGANLGTRRSLERAQDGKFLDREKSNKANMAGSTCMPSAPRQGRYFARQMPMERRDNALVLKST
ncbi:hypothetical protein BKA80DRAFT_75338 [Phyllosticta citrichinensis]